jgi:hypothetical protein
LTTAPELVVTGAITVEPMIVGPTTVLICPMAGPVNERTAPQVVEKVPPVVPPTDALLRASQPAVDTPDWAIPMLLPPGTPTPVGQVAAFRQAAAFPHVAALAPETGTATANAPIVATMATRRLKMDLVRWVGMVATPICRVICTGDRHGVAAHMMARALWPAGRPMGQSGSRVLGQLPPVEKVGSDG